MASEMVERVARAMWAERVRHAREVDGIELEAYDEFFGAVKASEANNILGEASAAVVAMREPTEEMTAACWPQVHPWGKNAPDPSERPKMFAEMENGVTANWQAMIDAALKE